METFLSIHRITIPPLPCCFPLSCHPEFHEMKEAADSWILSRFNPSSEDHRKVIVQSQIPLLVSLVHVTGDRRRCFSVLKFMAWLFFFDDINDDPTDIGGNVTAAEELFQSLINTLEAKPSSRAVPRIVAIALEWWSEISEDMTARQQSRFLEVLGDSLDAWKSQVSFREAQRIPDVQTYILRRRKTSAMFPCLVLLEYSLGMELDEGTMKNPLISQLHDVVTDHVSWSNDLLSLKAEYARGDYGNLPSVVFFNESPNFQESVLQVCRLLQERDEDFVRLLNEFKKSNLMEKPGLERYVEGLGNWMVGNLHWSYATARYHGVDGEPRCVDSPLHVVLHPPQRDEFSSTPMSSTSHSRDDSTI